MKNSKVWMGNTSETLAALHFKDKGYAISWPDVDTGYDFLAHRDDEYIRVQVKTAGPKTGVHPENNKPGGSNEKKRADMAAAALLPRPYDVFAIVSDPYIWLMPAIVTHGKTNINVTAIESKYHVHREELAYGRRTPQTPSPDQGRES